VKKKKLLTSQELFDLLNERVETNTKVLYAEEVTKKYLNFIDPLLGLCEREIQDY
jgi:hypothetical protein